jgi:hypothetical protein
VLAQKELQMPVLVAHLYDTSRSYHDESGGPLDDSLDKFPFIMHAIAAAGPPAQQHQHFLVRAGRSGAEIVCQQGPFQYAEMIKEPRLTEAFKCRMAVKAPPSDQVDIVAGLVFMAATLRSTPQVRSRGLIIYGNLTNAGAPPAGLDLRGLCVGLVYGRTDNLSGHEALEASKRMREAHENWRSALLKAGAHEVRLSAPVRRSELWKWFAVNLWECLRLPPYMLRGGASNSSVASSSHVDATGRGLARAAP